MKKLSIVFYFIYLFTFFQLVPAFESIQWNDEHIEEKESHDLFPIKSHLRSKRFWGTFFVAVGQGVATSVISGVINNAITGGKWGRSIEEDKNPEMINKMINNDMVGLMKVKEMMMKMDPDAGKMIEVSEEGFTCDETFCSTRNSLYGMGICTPYSCRCKNNAATPLTCKGGRMFNPTNSTCESSMKMAFCGH